MENENSHDFIRTCPNCGAVINGQQSFCSKCGTALKQEKNLCGNCGAELQSGQSFCHKCGHKLDNFLDSGVASPKARNEVVVSQKPKRRSKVLILILALVVLAVIILYISNLLKNNRAKEELKMKLETTDFWAYQKLIDGDPLIKTYLDFQEDTIEFTGEFGVIGEQFINDYSYEVLDGNTIQVGPYKVYVEFCEDCVTFSPSFLDGEPTSLWMIE